MAAGSLCGFGTGATYALAVLVALDPRGPEVHVWDWAVAVSLTALQVLLGI